MKITVYYSLAFHDMGEMDATLDALAKEYKASESIRTVEHGQRLITYEFPEDLGCEFIRKANQVAPQTVTVATDL